MRKIGAILILIVLALGGCASPTPTPVPPTATTVPPTATPTQAPMATARPTQSGMVMPTPSQPMSGTANGLVPVIAGYYTEVSPDQLKSMLEKKDFVFINVHAPYAGEIANTDAFIPADQIAKNLDKLPQDKGAKIMLYCKSGMMSKQAAETLVKLGYTNIFHLDGGMNAWGAQKYPLLNNPK